MGTVKSIRVVLVSPSDVAEERKAVRTAIQQVNSVAARDGVTFDLHCWENLSPGYHPDGPQALIETELDIDQCDLLIGIFWNRFGIIDHAPYSRTAREILQALEARRVNSTRPDIKVYFCKRPFAPNSVEETDQQGRVLEFKRELEKLILYRDYLEVQDFHSQVLADLFEYLIECLPKASGAQPSAQVQLSAHVTAVPILLRSESLAELVGDLQLTIYGKVPPSWVGDLMRLNISVFLNTSIENQAAEDGRCDVVLLPDSADGSPLSRGRLLVAAEHGDVGIGISFEEMAIRIEDLEIQQNLWIRGLRANLSRFAGVNRLGASVALTVGNDKGYTSILPPQRVTVGISLPACNFSARRTSPNLDFVTWPTEEEGHGRSISLFTLHFLEGFPGAFKTRVEEAGGVPGVADCGDVLAAFSSPLPEHFDLFVTAHELPIISTSKAVNTNQALAVQVEGMRTLKRISEHLLAVWHHRVLPSGQMNEVYVDTETPMVRLRDFPAAWEFVSRVGPQFFGAELIFGVALIGPGNILPPTGILLCGGLAPISPASNQDRGIPSFLPSSPQWFDLQ